MNEQGYSLPQMIRKIKGRLTSPLRFMEVCGTHTTAIARAGIRALFTPQLELVSGPGCPVCVTSQADLDQMILLARYPEITIVTFGDLLRVPGSGSTLEIEQASGADIRVVYSPLEAVKMAQKERGRQFVFLGVGFETTAPAIAMSVQLAAAKKLSNYSVLSCLKTMPPALHTLLQDKNTLLNGLLLPGHVSAVTGRASFSFVADRYHLPAVIAGFTTEDIVYAIYRLAEMAVSARLAVVNGYPRVVREQGNLAAAAAVNNVFTPSTAQWRGFGTISGSGLSLRRTYAGFDARRRFPVTVENEAATVSPCRCADVLLGKLQPGECILFGKTCTPLTPQGPCMVSSEGACAACFRFEYKKAVYA